MSRHSEHHNEHTWLSSVVVIGSLVLASDGASVASSVSMAPSASLSAVEVPLVTGSEVAARSGH